MLKDFIYLWSILWICKSHEKLLSRSETPQEHHTLCCFSTWHPPPKKCAEGCKEGGINKRTGRKRGGTRSSSFICTNILQEKSEIDLKGDNFISVGTCVWDKFHCFKHSLDLNYCFTQNIHGKCHWSRSWSSQAVYSCSEKEISSLSYLAISLFISSVACNPRLCAICQWDRPGKYRTSGTYNAWNSWINH